MYVCLQAVYTASIPEDIPVSSVLLRVGATDGDIGINAWIKYSLHGPGSQDFSMDADTGMVLKTHPYSTFLLEKYITLFQ